MKKVYYKHSVDGRVIGVPESWKMLPVWEKLTDFKVVPKKEAPVKEEQKIVSETVEQKDEEKQVFSSVVALKADADTSKNAFTARGAEYSYTDGTWAKVE